MDTMDSQGIGKETQLILKSPSFKKDMFCNIQLADIVMDL